MPFLPESLRGRAVSVEADPFRYLRGVLAFLVGGGAVVALILGLTGISRGALILAGVLWTLLGLLSGLVDWLLEPMIDFTVKVLSNVGLVRAGGGFSAEETLAAQGHTEAAAEAYRLRAQVPKDRVAALLRRAELMADPLKLPHAAVGELEKLQQEADHLRPIEDMRLGLVLAELYEQRLDDPGRAMGEIRRLIDRYPQARQTGELRGLLAALRRQHFSPPAT